MRKQIIAKLRGLPKNWLFWLLVVTSIAIVLRSLPAWTNRAWGCDFGIYYGLTNSFVKNMALFNPYYGWGDSYQYFPVLYAITGVAHWITGIDVLTLMPKIAPIFGGLSIFIFYFVVYELLGDRKTALLASLFFAVMPFHVYQTSHASPLTMGHFFMMVSLYLFIKYRHDKRYIVPLLTSTMLLIMSHHLTTYFYLISIIFIVFIENARRKEWTSSVKSDTLYILMASGLVFSYWAFVATPVYNGFMITGLSIGSIHAGSIGVIVLFYTLFFSLFGLIWLKRRYNLFYEKAEPTQKSCLVKFLLALVICLAAMNIFSVVKMPWTNFSFTPLSILYAMPLLVVFCFVVAGFRYTRFIRNGDFIRGWLLAILLSFTYMLVTNNEIIPPDRHLEYLMAPISIIAIYGLKGIFYNIDYTTVSAWSKKHLRVYKPWFNFLGKSYVIQKGHLVYVFVVIILVTTNAVSVYPAHVALNASYEAITNEDMTVVQWIEKNLDKNTSIVASDHRLARMAEAIGFNTTLDTAIHIWDTENVSDYLNELLGEHNNYSRITHVVIDDIMRDRVVHVGFGKIVYMINGSSQVAYEKFSRQPFELLYRNATFDKEMKVIHWAEVYAVNWTFVEGYIEEHTL